MSSRVFKVWDPLVRLFHWSLVIAFTANALFTNPDGTAHQWVGYAVVALIGLRIFWGLVGGHYARFASFPPSAQGAMRQLSDVATGRKRAHLGHTPLGALMIYNLLVSILAIGATGWILAVDPGNSIDWVEELHEGLVTWAEISIIAHVVAVIWESRRTGVNLPRAMVSGVKTVPGGVMIEP